MSRSGRNFGHLQLRVMRNGMRAYLEGKTEADCPYEDKRTSSRAWRKLWLEGWWRAKQREAEFLPGEPLT